MREGFTPLGCTALYVYLKDVAYANPRPRCFNWHPSIHHVHFNSASHGSPAGLALGSINRHRVRSLMFKKHISMITYTLINGKKSAHSLRN